MSLTEKQKQRVEGILRHVNDFLDKRFAQAKRINPKMASIEMDSRWHIVETLREILSEYKWFAQAKLLVVDVLSSADEQKKRELFNPEGQVSIQNEVIPADDQSKDKRTGQLEVHDVKSFYKALDPSLEKIIMLIQSWIWWDLRDAADLYRVEAQIQRLEMLKTAEIDANIQEFYRRDMQLRPDESVTREAVLRFELHRLREILDRYTARRAEDHGYQMIVVNREVEFPAEADAACVRLAKRLMVIERLRQQAAPLEDNARQAYAAYIGIAPEQVTAEAIIEFEQRHAKLDRKALTDQLSASHRLGEGASYKAMLGAEMQRRYEDLCAELGIEPQAPAPAAAQQPAAGSASTVA